MLPSIDWTACWAVTSFNRLEGILQIPLAYSPAEGMPIADRGPADLCMSNTAEVDKDPCGCAASAMAFARQRMFGGGKVRSSEMLAPTHQRMKAAGLLPATRGPAAKFV